MIHHSTPRYVIKESKTEVKTKTCQNNSISYNIQKVEMTQMFVNW